MDGESRYVNVDTLPKTNMEGPQNDGLEKAFFGIYVRFPGCM